MCIDTSNGMHLSRKYKGFQCNQRLSFQQMGGGGRLVRDVPEEEKSSNLNLRCLLSCRKWIGKGENEPQEAIQGHCCDP